MTVVVADTSPISSAALPSRRHPPGRLFRTDGRGCPNCSSQMGCGVSQLDRVRKAPPPDAELSHLDSGEASAIALAVLETNVLLLIDESAGRLEASRRGIPNTGTLGVLRRAAVERKVDLPSIACWPQIFESQRLSLPVFSRRTRTANDTATEVLRCGPSYYNAARAYRSPMPKAGLLGGVN